MAGFRDCEFMQVSPVPLGVFLHSQSRRYAFNNRIDFRLVVRGRVPPHPLHQLNIIFVYSAFTISQDNQPRRSSRGYVFGGLIGFYHIRCCAYYLGEWPHSVS